MNQIIFNSPIGPLLIREENEAIVEIQFDGKLNEESTSPLLEECKKQLEEYFNAERITFDLPLKPQGTTFQQKVWNQLQTIPYGSSINYSQLAVALGDLKSIRAAGTANGKNKIPIIIPCHRVIGKDGSLVGFAGGLDRKKYLLQLEGVLNGEQMSIFN